MRAVRQFDKRQLVRDDSAITMFHCWCVLAHGAQYWHLQLERSKMCHKDPTERERWPRKGHPSRLVRISSPLHAVINKWKIPECDHIPKKIMLLILSKEKLL